MPPRDPNMPEGTDSIIDGTANLSGVSDSISASDSFMDDDDGGDVAGGMGGGSAGFGSSSTGLGGSVESFSNDANAGFGSASSQVSATDQVKSSVSGSAQTLTDQASEKVRGVAEQGKDKATEALDSVSRMVSETADTVSERLGPQYGDYVRKAAGALDGLNDSIRGKEVDELFDDARNFVRQSPAVAIGAAAAIGFLLVRLVKSGLPQQTGGTDDFYGSGATQRLASPPRVDNSFDPVA